MRWLAILLAAVTGTLLVVRGALPCDVLEDQPDCLVAFLPGPTRNTFDLIEITGATTSQSQGELVLTTIVVDQRLSFREWIQSKFDSSISTYDRELIYPENVDPDVIDQQNDLLMQDSQLSATLAGLRAAGYEVSADPVGLLVGALLDGNLIEEGDLDVGDRLLAIEGEPVATIDDVIAVMTGRSPGELVSVTRQRGDDEPVTITVELISAGDVSDEPQRPLIGISLAFDYDLPVEVDINAGQIGGPSAGLMFALSIVDSLLPEDLTGGMIVAGTGTIDADGVVGAIGGIRQKVIGALDRDDAAPASVFLVPERNFAEAQRVPAGSRLLLVPVSTITDALDALEALREGRTPLRAVAIGEQ